MWCLMLWCLFLTIHQLQLNSGVITRAAGGLQVSSDICCVSETQLKTMTDTLTSSLTSSVGGQRDTVNNPMTWFGPLSYISRSLAPRGKAVATSAASDTCWPLPSLPDWQMAAPLDENDKWLSISRKDFLLTCDPWPWLLTPLRGRPASNNTPFPPSLPPFLSPGLCVSLSPLHRCRTGLSDVESRFCSSEGGIYRREKGERR